MKPRIGSPYCDACDLLKPTVEVGAEIDDCGPGCASLCVECLQEAMTFARRAYPPPPCTGDCIRFASIVSRCTCGAKEAKR